MQIKRPRRKSLELFDAKLRPSNCHAQRECVALNTTSNTPSLPAWKRARLEARLKHLPAASQPLEPRHLESDTTPVGCASERSETPQAPPAPQPLRREASLQAAVANARAEALADAARRDAGWEMLGFAIRVVSMVATGAG